MKYIAPLLIILMAGAVAFADNQSQGPKAQMTGYDVAFVKLHLPVEVKTQEQSKQYSNGYLVRLHGTYPAKTARVMQLSVGDKLIAEYGGIENGLYFILYEKGDLTSLEGLPFKYRMSGDKDWIDLGMTFEPSKFDLEKAKKEADALLAK